jgi:hypothetical protein
MRGVVKWRRLVLVGALLAGGPAGCRGRAATAEDCRAVVERLVELELAESGFRDPTIVARWKRTLGARLAPELMRCEGRRVPAELRTCLASAPNAEAITHGCLK